MGHRNKTDEEKKILQDCIDECNALPNRSTQKRILWTECAKKLTEKGYNYTADDVYVYYNNRKSDNKKASSSQKSSSSTTSNVQTPFTPPQVPTPPQPPTPPPPRPQIQSEFPPQQFMSPFLVTSPPQSTIQPDLLSSTIPPLSSESPFPIPIPESPFPLMPPPTTPSPLPPNQQPPPFSDSSEISSTKPSSILKQERHDSTSISNQSEKPKEQHINISIPRETSSSYPQQITDENSPSNSPYSSSAINPPTFDSSFDQLSYELIPVPNIGDDIQQDIYDRLKYDLYQCLQNYYDLLWRSYDAISTDDSDLEKVNESLFKFQKKTEKRFVKVTELFTEKLQIKQVYSHDNNCENVPAPKIDRTISRNTRYYNKDYTSFSSASNSSEISIVPSENFPSSADKFSKKENENENEEEEELNDKVTFEPFIRRNFAENLGLPEKIVNFYMGQYNRKTEFCSKLVNVESSIIISYKNDDKSDFVCDFAYVDFNPNSHVLHFRDLKVETGFFLPTTTMYFHRIKEEKINLIYICGDQRIKEFRIDGIDSNSEIEITNTNTFYFGENYYKSSVITVWNDELVFACNSTVYFWDLINDENNGKVRTRLKINANVSKAKNTGIDMNKIDWKEGKLYKEGEINIDKMEKITSLAVVNKNQFLAVASKNYPVIYLYNKNHQNVFRLISHTMGITSLKSINNTLISGSADLNAKLWDLKKCRVLINFDTSNQHVSVVEAGVFCKKAFLFTGGKTGTVIVYNIYDKKAICEINLPGDFVPKEIAFISAKNDEKGDFAKLMIISYRDSKSALKDCMVQSFDF